MSCLNYFFKRNSLHLGVVIADLWRRHGRHLYKQFVYTQSNLKKNSTLRIDLAKQYSNIESLAIAEVDCTKNGQICELYDVGGYPTLALFKNGFKIENYSNRRDLTSFSSYLDTHLEKVRDEL